MNLVNLVIFLFLPPFASFVCISLLLLIAGENSGWKVPSNPTHLGILWYYGLHHHGALSLFIYR